MPKYPNNHSSGITSIGGGIITGQMIRAVLLFTIN